MPRITQAWSPLLVAQAGSDPWALGWEALGALATTLAVVVAFVSIRGEIKESRASRNRWEDERNDERTRWVLERQGERERFADEKTRWESDRENERDRWEQDRDESRAEYVQAPGREVARSLITTLRAVRGHGDVIRVKSDHYLTYVTVYLSERWHDEETGEWVDLLLAARFDEVYAGEERYFALCDLSPFEDDPFWVAFWQRQTQQHRGPADAEFTTADGWHWYRPALGQLRGPTEVGEREGSFDLFEEEAIAADAIRTKALLNVRLRDGYDLFPAPGEAASKIREHHHRLLAD